MLQPPSLCFTRFASHVRVHTYTATAPHIRARTCSVLCCCAGADIDAEDEFGDNALTIAGKFGHKGCERHLFLFRWQQRAKQIRAQVYVPMFAHQYHDSAFPVWFKGPYQQIYFRQILPPGEFDSSAINARKKPGFMGYGKDGLVRLAQQTKKLESPETDDTESDDEIDSEGRKYEHA